MPRFFLVLLALTCCVTFSAAKADEGKKPKKLYVTVDDPNRPNPDHIEVRVYQFMIPARNPPLVKDGARHIYLGRTYYGPVEQRIMGDVARQAKSQDVDISQTSEEEMRELCLEAILNADYDREDCRQVIRNLTDLIGVGWVITDSQAGLIAITIDTTATSWQWVEPQIVSILSDAAHCKFWPSYRRAKK